MQPTPEEIPGFVISIILFEESIFFFYPLKIR